MKQDGGQDSARWLGGDQLMEWARRARAGESVVYGQGERLPVQALAVPRALADAGVVSLVCKRRGTGFAFIAQRRARLFVDPAQVAERRASRGAVRGHSVSRARSTERALLKLLARCARNGVECPSDAVLAKMLGLPGRLSASYRLHRLARRGLIEIDHPHPHGPRIVTICATGARTADGGRK